MLSSSTIISLIFLRMSIAIPVLDSPSANFRVRIPLYTAYIDPVQTKFGAISVDINLTIDNAAQEGKRDFNWITYVHPMEPEAKVRTPIWNMSCTAIAKKAFDGLAEFTFTDEYPWVTAGVNASGVQDGSAGIQCPTGRCLSEICEGLEVPVIDTFLNSY
ncbi:uncharacterized protein I303_106074 [Kwoniella dejecticola CBS 10117]|uniref:Uncharacterized protein n=1 Tax=Kwoniella dejecticola CBS 10117 TaxID=1296121 RepID=A0A1A6A171_9TREE|nr:uncharacterized protein I303_06094 [Kwoniella dejecticola CBS 10117]OBR83811.1 hypothetical protein I303_06094 [Kwoniella dejecticola CBS 10117]